MKAKVLVSSDQDSSSSWTVCDEAGRRAEAGVCDMLE